MPNDLPDWQQEIVIAAGGVSSIVASGLIAVAGAGHSDIAIPYTGGYPYLRLIVTDIEAVGAAAKWRLQVGTDALGGAYTYQYFAPNLGAGTLFGPSTGIDLLLAAPAGTAVTAGRGDNAASVRSMLEVSFYNGDLADTGAGQQPPLHFWGRGLAMSGALANPDVFEFAGYYTGARWSVDQFLRIFDTAAVATSSSAKYAIIGYHF